MEMFALFNETSRSEESYLEIACPTYGVDSNGAHQGIMGSSLGEFGDFNSDGLIDFVLGDYFESTCNFYLGVISNGSYALNQVNSDVWVAKAANCS